MKDKVQSYYEEACEVGRTLQSWGRGHWAYFVGGCVRDEWMHRIPKDYDIVTNVLPETVQKIFPKTHLVGAKFGIVMVETESGKLVEVATARVDGAYTDGRRPDDVIYTDRVAEDLTRRDFTINAMIQAPWAAKSIGDPFDGQGDIKEGVIRTVGTPAHRFVEDALRMLRAVRFACQLDFTIEPATYTAICDLAGLIKKVSIERIREELFKILISGNAQKGFSLLINTGLLDHICPEMSSVPWYTQQTLGYLPKDCSPTIGLAILCMWMRSRITQTTTLAKFKLSTNQFLQCEANLRCHRVIDGIYRMSRAYQIRIAREWSFPEQFECFKVLAKGAGKSGEIEKIDAALKELPSDLYPTPLLTGDDLIALGYVPGPNFKGVLTEAEEQQLNGGITTKEQAISLARTLLNVPA